MIDFQQVVTNRIGLGKAQYMALAALALVQMNDGIQAIAISLVTPILKTQLSLNEGQISLLTSIFYIGVGLGALISGVQSQKYGRKPALMIGTCCQIVSGLLLSFNISFEWICGCRVIYGMGFGSTLAVATLLITQFMPMNQRGKTLLIISFMNSIGKLGGVGLAFIFLNDVPNQVSIAHYMVCLSMVNICSLILIIFFIKESYRYLLSRHKYQEAFSIINQTIFQNKIQEAEPLTETQKQEIQLWGDKIFTRQQQKHIPYGILLINKRTTLLLSIGWFCISFIFFGEMFIVPFMIGNESSGMIKYLWMTLGELPALIMTFCLIDRQGFGRKHSLVMFYGGCFFLSLYVIKYIDSVSLFFTKMFMKAVFQMIYPFTSESYPTSIRSIGFSVNSAIGRFGSTIMPFIIYPIYNAYPDSPFLIFAFVSLIGGLCIWGIQNDTYLRPLDQMHSKGQIELNSKIEQREIYAFVDVDSRQ